ncbi:MAG: nucleotidyl transferase AbiEii/AbiGii toxin family protein [Elusimicrobia bacterium]|nr:nucleotidyl transferase AbiEii/AbiGii toxin family protein [Elusimicrobiota bacterium]
MDKLTLQNLIPVIAKKYNFRTAIIEKDYYLTVILNSIESRLTKNLVFKGGTLLNKIYLNYNRLSEDLDFCYYSDSLLTTRSQRSKAIAPIREKMATFVADIKLRSENPRGKGFNNSTQYLFVILYDSIITGKEERIKIEISLRQLPIDKPVHNEIKHFFQDPFTGKDIMPRNRIMSLSLKETVAEKLRAAITREKVAIRDYYDLWQISQSDFNFSDKHFIGLFRKKLEHEKYKRDYKIDFGLNEEEVKMLHNQVETDLLPVVRVNTNFELNKVFERFNEILKFI